MYRYLICIVFFLFSNLLYAEQEGVSNNLSSLLIFPFLFVLMYFILIRPQAKKAKEHKDLIKNLKINDEIVTQCGMLGKVLKLTENFAVISLNDNVNIVIKRDAIATYIPKGTLKQIK
ncbi:MAG TPA: preprotein translocase subunit YajC [Candidatus Azoamicus sp. MARI]